MNKYLHVPVLMVLALNMTGCFPIDLDVNAQGELLIPRQEGFFVYQPLTGKASLVKEAGDGKPLFGRFSADGSQVLLIDQKTEGFDKKYRFQIMPIKEGKPRIVYETDKASLNVLFAPDGSQLLVVQEGRRYTDDDLPTLHVLDVATGKARFLVKNAAPQVRWFADSKRLLLCQITEKGKEQSHHGRVCILDVAKGTTTPLFDVLGDQTWSCLDFSPDRSKILLTCLEAGPVESKEKLKAKYGQKSRLFEYDIAKKKLRLVTYRPPALDFARFIKLCGEDYFSEIVLRGDRLIGKLMPGQVEKIQDDEIRQKINGKFIETIVAADRIKTIREDMDKVPGSRYRWSFSVAGDADDSVNADFFRFSPDGKRLLLAVRGSEHFGEDLTIMVADAALTRFRTILTDGYQPWLWYAPGINFPGWIDADHIFYLTSRHVYGTTGTAIELTLRRADGMNRRVVQPDLDISVLGIIEKH